MKNARIDIGSIRREQIVDAAVAVIAEQGLQNLSLSEIEKKAGMTRGHLMYYFPAKEDILLSVFDRLLRLMCEQHRTEPARNPLHTPPPNTLAALQFLLPVVMQGPEANPEFHAQFHALQYTFLSQISHREDFRQRLASLYEDWRGCMTDQLVRDRARGELKRTVPPRTMASLIQAILHGLAMQLAADPNAFDRQEMLELCLDMLGTYLGANSARAGKNGSERSPRGRRGRRRRREAASR
jgi:AcrR family transcriptional regulator